MLRACFVVGALLLGAASLVHAGTTQVVTMSYKANFRVNPFQVQTAPDFAFVDGATVSIEFGYLPNFDKLYFDYNGQYPIVGAFNAQNGVLYLTGAATTSEYLSAINSVVFFTTSDDGQPRTVTWTFGTKAFFFSLTEHVYKFIDQAVSWTAAASLCQQLTYFGVPGYLATVTSADEHLELAQKATSTYWLGASDKAQFNVWSWVTGPEANMSTTSTFWLGQSQYLQGQAVENAFAAWNRFQPTNVAGSGNDFVYLVNSADYTTAFWAAGTDNLPQGGYICEFGAPWGAQVPSGISGSVSLYVDCGLYTDSGDCANHNGFGCSWISGGCVQSTCGQYHTQPLCVSDARCEWNVDGPAGVCAPTRCASSGQDACQLEASCLWTGSTCTPRICESQTIPCQCNKQDGCTWRAGQCQTDLTADCNGMDVIFLMDASTAMASTFGRYTQGFFAVAQSLLGAGFSLTGTSAGTIPAPNVTGMRVGFVSYGASVYTTRTEGSQGRLSGSLTEVTADLNDHISNFQPRQSGRYINAALQKASSMFDGAIWRKRVIVVLAAGNITDAPSIAQRFSANSQAGGVLAALQQQNVVIIGAALKATAVETTGSYAAYNSLLYLVPMTGSSLSVFYTTVENFDNRAIYGICGNATSLSRYVRPSPPASLLCSSLLSPGMCATEPTCGWDSAQQLCLNSGCTKYCSTSACNADNACNQPAGETQCQGLCSSLNETQCGVSQGVGACTFYFPTDACINLPCVGNPTEDGCIADPAGCYYNPAASVPCQPTPCNTDDSATCTKMGCTWGTSCFLNTCKQLMDATSCQMQPNCGWQNGACDVNYCGQKTSESTCNSDFACLWSTGMVPPACVPAPCAYYNVDQASAQSNCQANSTCLWVSQNGKNQCVQKTCDRMTRACDCAKLSGCIWRNDQCKDDTFVQCPATDVLFLVEATPVMFEGFGRHPNGYIGIVEAIRNWGRQAPWSTASLAATGFRVGFMSYGQNRAFSVPAEIGGGGSNFTSDPANFIGPNQILDYFISNAETYATGGYTGGCAVGPALRRAYDIFSSEGVLGRNKMIVILGNSELTDQDPNMNQYITMLEALGVNIFANIVRRFSFITPQDVIAGQFMSPVASSPTSTFFTYTTIDEMSINLLDNFCDPSTSTGKVLGISRDNELPCSWLSGQTECNIQGSCLYNAQAALTCALPGQCPSAGCRSLPANIAKNFNCDQCRYVSGAFVCSRSRLAPVPKGVCQKSTCATTCMSQCPSVTGCAPNTESNRCERSFCGALPNMTSCNLNLGCVWVGALATGVCQQSICGKRRTTCESLQITEGLNAYYPCVLRTDLTPSICVQARCPQLLDDACQALPAQCTYNKDLTYRVCADKTCSLYADGETCEFDSRCFWDPYTEICSKRVADCVLSGYSDWSSCSSTCGAAVTYKTRSVLQAWGGAVGSLSCPQVAALKCDTPTGGKVAGCDDANTPKDATITVVRTCTAPPDPTGVWIPPNPALTEGMWEMSCPAHCGNITDRVSCAMDASCRWVGSVCQATSHLTCSSLLTQESCQSTDQCAWNTLLTLCQPQLSVCNYTTPDTCASVGACTWRMGTSSVSLANQLRIPVQLYNPGMPAIFPFVGLEDQSSLVVNGATVTIESNYERSKDVLQSTYNLKVTSQWLEQVGTLKLSGTATVSDYIKTIRYVSFQTTSTRTSPRRISWSFGNNTVFSSTTRHHYLAVNQLGAGYDDAMAYCERKKLFGLNGYLATIVNADENQIVTSKLFANGWVSGDDATQGTFAYSSGPEKGQQFWQGPSATMGGAPVNGAYSNWAPPSTLNVANLANGAAVVNGQPVLNKGAAGQTGVDRVYVSRSGFWESRSFDSVNVEGFICEFGGMQNDVMQQFPIGGAVVVGMAGCIPQACVWHSQQADCNLDIECTWNNGQCVTGCASLTTEMDCGRSASCKWDTTVLPPVCGLDQCAPLSSTACLVNPACEWDPTTQCRYKIGCGMFGNATTCNQYTTCKWSGTMCQKRSCSSYQVLSDCRSTPQCAWNYQSSTCVDQICTAGVQTACIIDTRCAWNMPDSVTLGFSPGTGYVFPFADGVEAPAQSYNVDGITVVITAGYQKDSDTLYVAPDLAQVFSSTFDVKTGTLFISVSATSQVTAFNAFRYLQTVQFASKSTNMVTRQLSYTLNAQAVYAPTRKTYYKVFPSLTPQTYAQAQAVCAGSTLFGLQGALAQIDSLETSTLVKLIKPQGWIGATSNAQSVWTWASSGMTFWRGSGALGTPAITTNGTGLTFAQWDLGEPAFPNSAAYSGSSGFWRSVVASSQQAGAVCMYGDAVNRMSDAASGLRLLTPAGCFQAPCYSLQRTQCTMNPTCRWSLTSSSCVRDTACQPGTTPDLCNVRQGCYWDFDLGMCQIEPANTCNQQTNQTYCASSTGCAWNSNLVPTDPSRSIGGCVFQGCGSHPVASACASDANCKWTTTGCINRLCGYTTSDSCWADSLCRWREGRCQATPCAGMTNATICNAADTCSWQASTSTCLHTRCSTKLGLESCLKDTGCLFLNGACFRPPCVSTASQATCSTTNPQCYFFTALKTCDAAQCLSYNSESTCEQGQTILSKKPCIWTGSSCRQPTYEEQNAPPGSGECQKQTDLPPWWLWLFLAVILLMIAFIVYKLYMSSRAGGGIFEPTRKNYKYNPHEQYASELFEDAKVTGVETNMRV